MTVHTPLSDMLLEKMRMLAKKTVRQDIYPLYMFVVWETCPCTSLITEDDKQKNCMLFWHWKGRERIKRCVSIGEQYQWPLMTCQSLTDRRAWNLKEFSRILQRCLLYRAYVLCGLLNLSRDHVSSGILKKYIGPHFAHECQLDINSTMFQEKGRDLYSYDWA